MVLAGHDPAEFADVARCQRLDDGASEDLAKQALIEASVPLLTSLPARSRSAGFTERAVQLAGRGRLAERPGGRQGTV